MVDKMYKEFVTKLNKTADFKNKTNEINSILTKF